jgi:DNA-binding Xre family transcriptional regulator
MVDLKVREVAEKKGIVTPFALSKATGIAYSNCHKMWNDQQSFISLAAIDRLCETLDCEPGDLLVRTGSAKKARKAKRR